MADFSFSQRDAVESGERVGDRATLHVKNEVALR